MKSFNQLNDLYLKKLGSIKPSKHTGGHDARNGNYYIEIKSNFSSADSLRFLNYISYRLSGRRFSILKVEGRLEFNSDNGEVMVTYATGVTDSAILFMPGIHSWLLLREVYEAVDSKVTENDYFELIDNDVELVKTYDKNEDNNDSKILLNAKRRINDKLVRRFALNDVVLTRFSEYWMNNTYR